VLTEGDELDSHTKVQTIKKNIIRLIKAQQSTLFDGLASSYPLSIESLIHRKACISKKIEKKKQATAELPRKPLRVSRFLGY
jgi:hypothetical protein